MDYDNDGVQDIISGSYDPGDIYLIKGLGDGEYAKVEKILDENEVPLVHHPVELAKYQKYTTEKEASKKESSKNGNQVDYVPDSDEATQWRVSSFGSWPASVDWDGDGDLDLLIGTFAGQMYLRTNTGNRSQPNFSGDTVRVLIDGKPLKETGHAAPVVADWDNDGMWDLVVGSSDGSVGWYRNEGTVGSPKFAARKILVYPKAQGKFLIQYATSGKQPTPGVRAQICVTDYNNDGHLDLFVGDYKDVNWVRELSEPEQQQFDELVALEKENMDKMMAMRQDFANRYKDMSDEERTQAEEEMQKASEKFDWAGNEKKKKEFYSKEKSIVSNVWLYLRNPGGEQLTKR